MTAKEKAKELFDKMEEQQEGYYLDNKQNSKNCALVAVNEIILIVENYIVENYEAPLSITQISDYLDYWQQVKQEIEKL